MMESMLTAIGVLALMATWRWPYRMTALDSTRDRLFDLREEVRAHFIDSGAGLSHPIYIALRNLINGHIRHTESASLVRFLVLTHWVDSNRGTSEAIRDKIERRFKTDDAALKAYVKQVRARAFNIMFEYVVTVSLLGWVLLAIGIVVLLCMLAYRLAVALFNAPMTVAHRVAAYLKACGITLDFARAVAVAGAMFAIMSHVGLGGRIAAEAAMEDCALYESA